MYYPKQIPYLLDKEFNENIEYKEHKIKELNNFCMCIWEMKSKRILNKTISNNILPDACIDLVIDFSNKIICFAGFSKETEPFKLNQKVDYMGVRLKPGVFYAVFHIDAYKIMDNMISFKEIENEIELDPILTIDNPLERLKYLKEYLIKKFSSIKEKEMINIVDELYSNPEEQKVIDIASNLRLNKKQLYRVFKKYYGISPKVLLNILRLHLCLTLLFEKNSSLSEIANASGFYDQSHFIKEIKRYTGISPLKLLDEYSN
ncbi:MAG: helix-turn-helix transcriptional regulator [Ruminococcus sp.]|nr:helix-turn-helix transcriptional regulator [Ruminococcus sp.]